MTKQAKKIYQKPSLTKVDLTIEDAVLACCKTSSAVNSSGGRKRCNQTGCISTPNNLT